MSEPINRTPAHLRCTIGACPAVYELEDGQRLLIVGALAEYEQGTEAETTWMELVEAEKIGRQEAAIVIDLALLSDIKHLIP